MKSQKLKVKKQNFTWNKLFASCFTFYFSLLTFHFSPAQNCNCQDELKFVRTHMEKNHPGFNSDIKDPNQPAYKAFVASLEKKIANDPSGKYCIVYLKQYLRYLQDHHINIYGGNAILVREDSLSEVEAFLQSKTFLSTERIEMDSAQAIQYVQQLKDPGLEGIYSTPDGTYTIVLVKKPSDHRDYAGIILHSKTRLWQKGQVKLEVKNIGDSLMDLFIYMRNHSLIYDQIPIDNKNPVLPGWKKLFPASTTASRETIDNKLFSFKVLDSNTTYLSVTNFGGQYSTALDSFYKAVMPEIRKRPKLIIDVRNNGGGSDQNYKALMPLIYTDPIIGDVVDYYATPDNIKAYTQLRDLYKSKPDVYGAQGFRNWEYGMNKMQQVAPYTFVPMGDNKPSTTRYTAVKGYPDKVAVIYNRNCASSCESFLFEVRFSKKVITVGENSGGYTGYGNIMSISTPCGNTLTWTTTRYRDQRQYDFVGIPPKYRIPSSESDWVEYTRRLIID